MVSVSYRGRDVALRRKCYLWKLLLGGFYAASDRVIFSYNVDRLQFWVLLESLVGSSDISAQEGLSVSINGMPVELPSPATVSTLLERLGLSADLVAVEIDKKIIRRADWENTKVYPGASLEIVQFVGGG